MKSRSNTLLLSMHVQEIDLIVFHPSLRPTTYVEQGRAYEREDFRLLPRERLDLRSNNGSHRMPLEVVPCRARPSSVNFTSRLPCVYLAFTSPLPRVRAASFVPRAFRSTVDKGRHEVTCAGYLAFYIDLNGTYNVKTRKG